LQRAKGAGALLVSKPHDNSKTRREAFLAKKQYQSIERDNGIFCRERRHRLSWAARPQRQRNDVARDAANI
jgi:hypothetical protein